MLHELSESSGLALSDVVRVLIRREYKRQGETQEPVIPDSDEGDGANGDDD